jgi:hypothetical protein
MDDDDALVIAGQLDVFECIEIAAHDGYGTGDAPAVPAQAPRRPMSAAEVVRLKLAGQA